MFNVVVNGQTTIGLGHQFNLARAARSDANPFGLAFDNANNALGDVDLIWEEICNEDSDGDGLSNGEELCDPGCTWRPGDDDPDCDEGTFPTHPGFADENIQDVGVPQVVQIHAAMMILAWAICAPVGIISATLFKKNASGNVLWFLVHRVLLSAAAGLTVLGFLVMVNDRGTDIIFESIDNHPRTGIAVVAFAVLQPLSGFFRVHKKKGKGKSVQRLVWELQHQWTGRITVILAVASLASGIQIGFDNDTGGSFLIVVFGIVSLASFAYVFLYREPQIKKREAAEYETEYNKSYSKKKEVQGENYLTTEAAVEPERESYQNETFADRTLVPSVQSSRPAQSYKSEQNYARSPVPSHTGRVGDQTPKSFRSSVANITKSFQRAPSQSASSGYISPSPEPIPEEQSIPSRQSSQHSNLSEEETEVPEKREVTPSGRKRDFNDFDV
eukprot:augustus_masked-scaffold_10-processed-gene-9.34-mRNA-1 protein AED:0.17 eAED:0.81 QI:0/-1/0/1/-1/1/1/0/443